jgi:ribosomal protein S18 acetylase RimI-like enzyme
MAAYVGNALSILGSETVRRYYSSLHHGPFELVALGAFVETRLWGFLYGGMLRGEMSYFLSRNLWFLMGRIATHPWLVSNPLFRDRLKLGLGLIRRPEQMGRRPEEIRDPSLRSFGILSIAVDTKVQQRGVGSILMKAAEEAALARGYKRMHLTVHPDNLTAIRFYEEIGWTKHCVNGKWKDAMRKMITATRALEPQ